MSKTVKWILIIIGIIVAASVIALIAMRNHDAYPERGVIAHAGSAIDGHIYTNSLEAVENAIEKGCKFIELDLGMTSDSVLVAFHEWEQFRDMCGADSIVIPMSYDEFMSQRIHGKYHPLSAAMIDSIFMAHPELVLVTDKYDDADILLEHFSNLKDRMMCECYSDEAYAKVKKAGFHPMRNYQKIYDIRGPGRTYVMNKVTYDYLKYTYSYKIATKLLNSRINLYILTFPSNKAQADSLIAADPCIGHVYVDEL